MTETVFVLDTALESMSPVDAALALHVKVALERHVAECNARGLQWPAGLVGLIETAKRVIARQETTGRDKSGESVGRSRQRGARDDRELLDQATAAARLGRSVRTLQRMFDRGELAFVSVGGRRQVAAAEIDRFLDARRVEAGTPRRV